MSNETRWHRTPKGYDEGVLASRIIEHAHAVEMSQDHIYERLFRLGCLYDPYAAEMWVETDTLPRAHSRVQENVIASNVDTVVATIAPTEVRPRVLTDGADWKGKRRAAKQSIYAELLGKKIGAHALKVEGVKSAATKGTGLCKVVPDYFNGCVRAVEVLPEDLIVDEAECRTAPHWPKRLYHWERMDRDELMARYSKHAEKIENVHSMPMGNERQGRDDTVEPDSMVSVCFAWCLPIGRRGKEGYRPGRYVVCIPGVELVDEEYHDDFFPIARLIWTSRAGFFGIGGGERIAGHQRRINKMNWQVDRQLDQNAMPTTYVHQADASLSVKSRNAFGNIGLYRAAIPHTVIAPAVSGETYARLDRLDEKAYEVFGVARMNATSKKPAGLYSGAAIREHKDTQSDRFAMQEDGAERYELDIIWLGMVACKKLKERGIEPPTLMRETSFGPRKLKWSDVEPDELRLQLHAAASLSRTPAGRTASILEYAQAGVFTIDEARTLLDPHSSLDINATMSLYQTHIDVLDMLVEEMYDGVVHVPEPHLNLEMAKRVGLSAAHRARRDGAPEKVLEILRQFTDEAARLLVEKRREAEMMNQPPPPETMMPPMPEAAGQGVPVAQA